MELIHADDLAIVETHSPYCVVCEVVGEDGEYLVMQYGPYRFRAKPTLFKPIPPPSFHVGQKIRTKPPRTIRSGTIRIIGWHYKTNQPSYYLAVGGKDLSTRYWEMELVPAMV